MTAIALAALLDEVRRCRLCADLPLGPRPLLQASPTARILIAGQAPGRKTHTEGIPFADPSGKRLRHWLGIDEATFYDPARIAIMPMGFCYPGTGPGGDLPPRPECAAAWRRPLLDEMPAIELTLLLGGYALDWHLGAAQRRTLTETVADWRAHWPRLLPLPHPSPRNMRWFKSNPWFEDEIVPELQARVRELIS